MKYVLFGGGGFIGSMVADRLLEEGHELRIFEHPRVIPYRSFKETEHVTWSTGDLLNPCYLGEIMDGADAVLHLISTTVPQSSNNNPIYDMQSNLTITLQILNAMLACNLRKIIFVSSGGTVYGRQAHLPIDEQHPTNPLVSYGITKLTIEKYLHLFESLHGIKAIILRVANPYGERQRMETAQGAVSIFAHRALTGLPLNIWGDGSTIRDYIHVRDLAEAFIQALKYSGPKSIFNISSGVGTSLNELLIMLENLLGKPIERHYLPGRQFDVPANILSNALAQEALQWTPLIPIRDGLGSTITGMKEELAKSLSRSTQI